MLSSVRALSINIFNTYTLVFILLLWLPRHQVTGCMLGLAVADALQLPACMLLLASSRSITTNMFS
jgi:hypothetical protein